MSKKKAKKLTEEEEVQLEFLFSALSRMMYDLHRRGIKINYEFHPPDGGLDWQIGVLSGAFLIEKDSKK